MRVDNQKVTLNTAIFTRRGGRKGRAILQYNGADDLLVKIFKVVGAGMAGVSTARRLRQRGLEDILVVEGTNRIGGRLDLSHWSWSIQILDSYWLGSFCHLLCHKDTPKTLN